MLFNKDWESQDRSKIDPMSMDGLIAWLETKDPSQRYPFHGLVSLPVGTMGSASGPNARCNICSDNSYVYRVHGQTVGLKNTPLVRVAANSTGTSVLPWQMLKFIKEEHDAQTISDLTGGGGSGVAASSASSTAWLGLSGCI